MVDGLNTTDKKNIFHLMSTVQVTGAKGYDTHILMHSATSTDDVSLYQEFQRNLSDVSRKYGVIDQVKYKKGK